MSLQNMFKGPKEARCLHCSEPIPKCSYEQNRRCTLSPDSDVKIVPCIAKLSSCPLALCYTCRLDLRRQLDMLIIMDSMLIDEAEELLKRPYSRNFVPESDGFSAAMAELPGCIAHGNDLKSAYEALHREALRWLAATMEYGAPIPKPEMEGT